MARLFKEANIFIDFSLLKSDFVIDNNGIFHIYDSSDNNKTFEETIDCSNLYVFPGFVDTHVHLREPGYTYKETIKTGTLSAAKGGYTHIFAMPNIKPVPNCIKNIQIEQKLLNDNALINVFPVCSITQNQSGKGNLSEIENLSNKGYRLFSDDGKGIQEEKTMKTAMKEVSKNNGWILAHCEDEAELCGGSLNEGPIAKKFNDPGINNASEYKQVIRDLKLAKQTHCNYHVCHISTKESVSALQSAKIHNTNVSGEVCCHHLFLNENNITEDKGKWKMNPPLRSVEDQQALIKGLIDGAIDNVCTDNAPHAQYEKDCSINDALMGVVSIELAFPLIYSNLVKNNQISLVKAIELMSLNAATNFKINSVGIQDNKLANLCIWDLDEKFIVDSSNFASLGKSCPFDGQELYGKCKMTICNGKIVYREKI